MKIPIGSAIVASLLLLLSSSDNEVAARQGQPEDPEHEQPSPRKVSTTRSMTGDSAGHHQNRELRGRSRSLGPNTYSYYDNIEEAGTSEEEAPPPYVRRVLVPRQEQIILTHRITFP